MTESWLAGLRAELERLRRAVWELECACPGRPELDAVYERLDELHRRVEEQADGPAVHEHDV
jgi:hypothetical protein